MTTNTDAAPSTPAAQWRVTGEQDPHGTQYDCERAALTLGKLTDDELANGVFMNADQPMNIARVLARDPGYHPPIVWLTAAKDRIRWLSRALERALAARSGDDAAQEDLKLPKLTEGEEFICDCGCGTIEPEQYDFEYSREEFPDGRVISKTEKAWRSPCCKACVLVYSNVADTFTPIEDYAPASSAGDQA